MTVTTTNTFSNGTGNGSNVTFPFTFRLMDDEDVVVTVAGVTKTLGADYSVAIDTDGVGGNVVFTSAPANGAAVVITRIMDLTQEVQQQVDQPPQELENIADKLTMLIQQVQAAISAGGVAGPGSSTNNSVVLWSGTSGTSLGAVVGLGTSGQVLTSQGAGLPPIFSTVSGTGTVTNFSVVADPSPLFSTSVSFATTTPQLTFTQVAAAANTVYGNATGSSANPSFGSIVSAQFGSGTLDTTHGGTGQDWSGVTAGRLPYFSGTGTLSTLAVGTNGHVLTLAAGVPTWAAVGAGTVTNMTEDDTDVSALFTTSLANPTTTPALTFTRANTNANLVWAGPASGAAAKAGFRSLVNNDLPVVDQSHGGTTFSGYADGDIIVANSAGNLAKFPLGTNGQLLSVNTGNNPKFAWVSAGSGTLTTITEVDTDVSTLFTSAITNPTTTPEITFTRANASANTVWAGPVSGGAAKGAYRALVAADLGLTTDGDLLVVDSSGAMVPFPLGANGRVLSVNTSNDPKLEWIVGGGGGGSGDVVGPASATNRTVALFDGTTGKLIKNGPSTLTDGLVLSSKGTGTDPTFQIAAIQGGGTGQDWSAVTAGRLPYFTGTGVLGTLAVGTNTQSLILSSGVPTWADRVRDISVPASFLSVATSTTTPALSLVNASAYSVWGNNSSSSGTPAYVESGQLTRLLPAAKTSNFTAVWGESYDVSTSGGAVAMTMPAATGSGKFIYVSLETAGNALTVNRAGSDTMSGLTSISTSTRYDGFLLHDIASGRIAVM